MSNRKLALGLFLLSMGVACLNPVFPKWKVFVSTFSGNLNGTAVAALLWRSERR